jgi:predicted metal-dependent hydrolase
MNTGHTTMTLFESLQCVVRRSKRARRIRLAIEAGGRVTLTLPWRLSGRLVERFLAAQRPWILSAHQKALTTPPRLLAQGDEQEYQAHKEEALMCITERVKHYQHYYGVTYNRLAIRNQKSRFGSCSAGHNLNFNYRLLFLPPELRDYVVVHELCHLRELNHSPKFWALVSETIPDYRVRKQELQAFSRIPS